MKLTIDELNKRLPLPATDKWKQGVWDIEALASSGVRLVFFAPRGRDYQTEHDEAEFYFIARGRGKLTIAGEVQDFETGDAFFVEAGVEHRFTEFTDDFATWAIFFESQA